MFKDSARIQHRRGFTLIEVMLVVAIIGCLATLCIPLFQRFAQRARKTELTAVLGKAELNFRNNFQSNGTYGTNIVSDWNPPAPLGTAAAWDSSLNGWQTYQFAPDGALYLRYRYTISNDAAGVAGRKLTLEAQGSFIGIPSSGVCTAPCNWTYTQTFEDGDASLGPVETPAF